MSDEEETATVSPDGTDPMIHAYDFLKHLTTLAIVSIGGVLGLLQNDNVDFPARTVMVVVATIGGGGGLALLTNSVIVGRELGSGARADAAKLRRLVRLLQTLSMGLYVFGIGIFVGAFSKAL